jgi:DNA repair and recombination protein RAD52
MDPNASVPIPQHEFPSFGSGSFTDEEKAQIQRMLETTIGIEDVCFREGPASTTVTYVVTQYIVNEADKIFGPGGWSCAVQNLQQDFLEETGGTYYAGYSATIRITLKDGCFREDIGYGTGESSVPAMAIGHAKKSSVTDGLKRTMRLFGSRLGNCLGDKQHTDALVETRPFKKRKR